MKSTYPPTVVMALTRIALRDILAGGVGHGGTTSSQATLIRYRHHGGGVEHAGREVAMRVVLYSAFAVGLDWCDVMICTRLVRGWFYVGVS